MNIRSAVFVTGAVNAKGYPPADRPEIAFAGRSNVGKSTLINALLGMKKLAKVSQTPGKTRQINFFDINDGAFYLVDLPGYGFAKVAKQEKQGWSPMMGRYLGSRETLRCVVILVDLRRGPADVDFDLADFLAEARRPIVLVFTKADKLKGNARRNQVRQICESIGLDPARALITSGTKHEGIEAVWRRLEEYL